MPGRLNRYFDFVCDAAASRTGFGSRTPFDLPIRMSFARMVALYTAVLDAGTR